MENRALGIRFSEFHTGYRAFSRAALLSVSYQQNSDDFVFDNEIIVQLLLKKQRFREIPVTTRYAHDSSSVGFWRSCRYGLGVLMTLARYLTHVWGLRNDPLFK